jgi:pSer/pThr/pTyr-binding forkhead associated (FHA) protein
MKIELVSIDAAKLAEQLSISQFPTVIGRSPKADLTLENRWISRLHCIIEADDDQVYVRDLGSANGTFLNDLQISRAKLHTGDKLSIGVFTFLVLIRAGKIEMPSTVIFAPGRGV